LIYIVSQVLDNIIVDAVPDPANHGVKVTPANCETTRIASFGARGFYMRRYAPSTGPIQPFRRSGWRAGLPGSAVAHRTKTHTNAQSSLQ
jgi:hypothetical protein